jgi:two-component system response regulator VicR
MLLSVWQGIQRGYPHGSRQARSYLLPANTGCIQSAHVVHLLDELTIVTQEVGEVEESSRILYIEDEQEMIDLVRLILGRKGFEVIGANGGKEGLKQVFEVHPDLVLLDLMMPDVDGWDVYQKLKADVNTSQIPVIVITAKAQSIDKVLGLHIAKVDDYIAKPFKPQELIESVQKVIKKSRIKPQDQPQSPAA